MGWRYGSGGVYRPNVVVRPQGLSIAAIPLASAFVRVVNETVQIVETEVSIAALTRVVDETVQVVETTVAIRGLFSIVDESVQVAEAIVRVSGQTRVVDETVQIADVEVRVLGQVRVVDEAVQVVETVISIVGLTRVVDEAVQIVETEVSIAALTRVVDETVQIVETEVSIAALTRVVDEAVQIVDVVARIAGQIRIVNEAVQIAESIVTVLSILITRVVDESVQVAETVVSQLSLNRIVNEAVQIVETEVSIAALTRVFDEAISIAETEVSIVGLIRVFDEAISIVETEVSIAALTRVFDEAISIVETEIHYLGTVVVINETVQVVEVIVNIDTLVTGFYETVSNRIREFFGVQVEDSLSLTVQYDNMIVSAPQACWVRLAVKHQSTEMKTTGRSRTFTMRGVVEAQILSPLSDGDFDDRTIAEKIKSTMQGKLDQAISYGSVSVSPVARRGKWYVMMVMIDFDHDFTSENTLTKYTSGVTLSSTQVGNSIRDWFGVNVTDAASISTQFDDAPYTQPETGTWVRFTIVEGAGRPVGVSGSLIKHRVVGIATAQVSVPLGVGDGLQLQTVDTIADAFRAVSVDGITFRAPSVETIGDGRDGKWWQANVACPFSYETVST